jgi:hypothetical protein
MLKTGECVMLLKTLIVTSVLATSALVAQGTTAFAGGPLAPTTGVKAAVENFTPFRNAQAAGCPNGFQYYCREGGVCTCRAKAD